MAVNKKRQYKVPDVLRVDTRNWFQQRPRCYQTNNAFIYKMEK